jgi:hypothetical protein
MEEVTLIEDVLLFCRIGLQTGRYRLSLQESSPSAKKRGADEAGLTANIPLSGAFVLPGFCDSHTHDLGRPAADPVDAVIKAAAISSTDRNWMKEYAPYLGPRTGSLRGEVKFPTGPGLMRLRPASRSS